MLIGQIRLNPAIAEDVLKPRTPTYMHSYIGEYLEGLLCISADNEETDNQKLTYEFLLWCKETSVLEPLTTHRAKAPPPIGAEHVRSWILEIDDAQLEAIKLGLRKLIDSPDHVPVMDKWLDQDVAEALLNMMDEKHMHPSPMIMGLCL